MTGQLGDDALTSDAVMDALKLCVSCKACRSECPTGVDMAKMKIEVLAARADKFGLSLRDRLVAFLPRYASLAARFAPLANLRNGSALLRRLFETVCRDQRAARAARMAQRCVRACRQTRSVRSTASRSCCSPTPSTAPTSARTSTPR